MNVLNGFHPSFDALSSFADQSDLDAARSRVGRHVARCDACRDVVREIRALGDAARAVELPPATAGLWARIERARAEEPVREVTAPARDEDLFQATPSLRPTRHVPAPPRRALRRAGVALLAAGIVLAVLLVPVSREEPLEAAGPVGTWRFSPARPAPGATVDVRYVPSPRETAPATMVLVAGYARPIGDRSGRAYNGINGLQDSLAVLTRQPDGAYAGRFVLPGDFTALVARLAYPDGRVHPRIMSTDGPVSRGYEPVALLVGGDAHGAPSLASLTAALTLWTGNGAARYDVADSLVRYFPREPIGYAAMRPPRARTMLDGLLGWFKAGERQYLKFDRRLMEQPAVSVEQAMAMTWFANRIDEPAEVRKWTLRAAREHPEDPRTLYQLGAMLVAMFNRPNAADSVRLYLPLADTLWERNGHRGAGEDMVRAASGANDLEAYTRWTLRAMQAGERDWRGDRMGVAFGGLANPAIRRVAEPLIRERIAARCEMPDGKYSLWDDRETWRERCIANRAGNFQGLSRIARLDGDPARALVMADSALALMASTSNCWTGGSHVLRGEALLDMGDRAAAAPELAWAGARQNWQDDALRDSLGLLLRPTVDSARWRSAVAAAAAEQASCMEARTRLLKERDARRRAAEAADAGR